MDDISDETKRFLITLRLIFVSGAISLLALVTAVKKPHDNISLGFEGKIAFFSDDFMLDTDKNEILAEDKIEVPMAGGADSSNSDSDSGRLNDGDGTDENCDSNDNCKKVEETSEEQATAVEQIKSATRATNYPSYYGGYSGDGSSSNTSGSSSASDTSNMNAAPTPTAKTPTSITNDSDDAGSPYGYYTDDNGGSIDDPLSK